jgi:adenine-specific DNA-methyltransferase
LDSTSIEAWDPDRDQLEQTLMAAVDHLKSDRTEQDILFELLVKVRGLDLCVPIETRDIADMEVHSIGGGALIVCLAPAIGRADVEALARGIVEWREELAPAGVTTCVFRDSAFVDDVAKTNLAEILKQGGLARVESL